MLKNTHKITQVQNITFCKKSYLPIIQESSINSTPSASENITIYKKIVIEIDIKKNTHNIE